MLTCHENSLPLTFFYLECEGRKTAPQTYVRDVIRSQQELNDRCRWNTQKRRFDKSTADAKAFSVSVPGGGSTKENQEIAEKLAWSISNYWDAPGWWLYRLSTGRAAHYKNIKPHNDSSKYWCNPADMHEGDYLIVDPACEVNEGFTREKNDRTEVMDDCDLPLDLELTE